MVYILHRDSVDMIFLHAFAATVEYRRCSRRRFPDRHKFIHTYQQLRVHGTIHNVCLNAERLVQFAVKEVNIFQMVERGVRVSTCRLLTSPFSEWVWETLHEDFFCQYRVQPVQHLELLDVGQRLEVYRWMGSHRL
jgi:hypothetical protein